MITSTPDAATLTTLDFAITREGDRVALYRVDRSGRMPVYRVWTRRDDRSVDWSDEQTGRSEFEASVWRSGGRI